MAKIEGFKIKNFRSLRDIEIGKLWNTKNDPLTPLTAVIGKNGVGKSSLFDAFNLLSNCLRYEVEEAFAIEGRRGINSVRSAGISEPMEFEIYYQSDSKQEPITYKIIIDSDSDGKPFVKGEWLFQRLNGLVDGDPFYFLAIELGKGYVWKNNTAREYVELNNNKKLGLATFGSLAKHPQIAEFSQFIKNWFFSDFFYDTSKALPLSDPQEHLNKRGDNLGNIVQYLEQQNRDKLNEVLVNISKKIPGIKSIKTESTPDGRLLLCFNEKGFIDPFYAHQMSDGTLKLFSYLLLLADPNPPPFICIEEPENGLYHKLLEILAEELREHATGAKGGSGGSQIFITTHQPYFIDAMKPDEVWILEKQDNGFSTIARASDNELIRSLVDEGLPLGSLWYSDYIDSRM